MPGLVGIITRHIGPEPVTTLKRMARRMTQDEESVSGTFCDPELGLFVAWALPQTLSVFPLPFQDAESNASLIFFGEHFPSDVCSNVHWAAQLLRSYQRFEHGRV